LVLYQTPLPLAASFASLSVAVVPLPMHGERRLRIRYEQAARPLLGRAHASSAAVGQLQLAAAPAEPRTDQRVQLVVLNPPAGASDYRWDLAGRGRYSLDTGPSPRTSVSSLTAGVHRVNVRVNNAGSTRIATLTLTIIPHGVTRGTRPHARGLTAGMTGPGATPRRSGLHYATAHRTRDPGVTIADFQFSPATTTIHLGDTITWTNTGPSSHTATARDGSFQTGVLQKGASASHTFTSPGTFAYYCSIHPFMHGTVVVLAATTSTTPTHTSTGASAKSPSGRPGAPAASPESSGQSLPMTGFHAITAVAYGLVLVASGLWLRRAVRR
jgi:plastocyanin